MNILHVIHSVDPSGGGPVEVVRQLGAAHRETGHRVEVVSLDARDAPGVGNFPLPLHTLRTRAARRGDYGFAPKAVAWLRRAMPEFDAVISHGLWQFHNLAVWRAARAASTPYFVFPHGMLDPWFRRRYPLRHFKKLLYWKCVESRVLRDAAAVIFTSDEERRLAHCDFKFDGGRDATLSIGTAGPPPDAERQQRAFFEKYPHLSGRRLLLFLGRLHEKKGCDLLIKAFAGHGGFHLVIAGPCADAGYLRELETLGARAGGVTFTGALADDLKWGALRAAEAFVLPSHQENFGVAIVEALACGTPVLISDKVNIWREVEAMGAALVEPDDLAGTARLLSRWMNLPPEQRATMREAARACFSERFGIHRAAAGLIDIIQTAKLP